MTMEKQPFEDVCPIQNRDFPLPLVNTSSNGCFSIVMLVCGGVVQWTVFSSGAS